MSNDMFDVQMVRELLEGCKPSPEKIAEYGWAYDKMKQWLALIEAKIAAGYVMRPSDDEALAALRDHVRIVEESLVELGWLCGLSKQLAAECTACSGETCHKCGAGLTNTGPCEHDVTERHEGML